MQRRSGAVHYLVGADSAEGQLREKRSAASLRGCCQVCHVEAQVCLLSIQVDVWVKALHVEDPYVMSCCD